MPVVDRVLSGGAPHRGGRAIAAPRARSVRLALCLLLALAALGCGKDESADKPNDKKQDAKAKEQPKPDFELLRLLTRPNEGDTIETSAKPGHWFSATQEAIANNDNFNGRLAVDPVPLPGFSIGLAANRPAALPKAQLKSLELFLYPPPYVVQSLRMRLTGDNGGTRLETMQPLVRMPVWQYYAVALVREPDRLAYLRDLDTFKPPSGDLDDGSNFWTHYRLIAPPSDQPPPLPAETLAWSSTALVLWEDADPAMIGLPQQQALLDWLHWGGQLVISGANSLDALRGTFLDPYLPADPEGTAELSVENVASLNDTWPGGRPLIATAPWTVQNLVPRTAAGARTVIELASHPLVVDRRAGRGRVVAVAFSLAERELTVWPAFDAFFNAALLGRPGRTFHVNADSQSLGVVWNMTPLAHDLLGRNITGTSREAELVSRVHYYSRDTHRMSSAGPENDSDTGLGMAGTDQPIGSSLGGWDDFNIVANQARRILVDASGLEMPSAQFVLSMLAVYAIVLVPVNWAVCRALGRVEWAWVAAPIITLVFAVAVVRLAQLNIGFARAETELAIVELQGNYPRAHVTRYTSLYTSLATRYAAVFADHGAACLPFANSATPPTASSDLAHDTTLTFTRAAEARLDGYFVPSNALGMLHSEHMLDTTGGLVVTRQEGGLRVENQSGFNLGAAFLVERRRACWIGDLPAGENRILDTAQFIALEGRPGGAPSAFNQEIIRWLSEHRPWEGSLDGVVELMNTAGPTIQDFTSLLSVERRLVAVTTDEVPGMDIEPAAEQRRRLTLVVVELDYPAELEPCPDHVTRAEALAEFERRRPAEDELEIAP